MKLVILALLFTLNLYAESDISELPTFICDSGDCGPAQTKILNNFLKASLVKIKSEKVYSGECYHLSETTDTNKIQYGVAYFVPQGKDLYWDGVFSFFYETNPFKDLTIKGAQEKFGKVTDNEVNKFTKLRDYLFINYGDEEHFTRYWMRTNKDQSQLYILGYWGIDHRILCQYQNN